MKAKANSTSYTLAEEYQYSNTEAVRTGRKWIDGSDIYAIALSTSITNTSSAQSLNIDIPSAVKSVLNDIVSLSGIWSVNSNYVALPRGHADNVHDGISLAVSPQQNIWIEWGTGNTGGVQLPVSSNLRKNKKVVVLC